MQLFSSVVPVRYSCLECDAVYEGFARIDDQHTVLAKFEHAHIMSTHLEDEEPDPGGGEEIPEGQPLLKMVGAS